MKRSKIYIRVFVVTILGLLCVTTVSGRIIPVAPQAKDNAEPYEHTDVITVNVDANWELNLPDNSAPPTVPTANGTTIPAFDMGKPNDNAKPDEHSSAIGSGWILTVPPNPTGVDSIGIDTFFGLGGTVLEPLGEIQNDITRQLEVPFESFTVAVVPEPCTLLLLAIGAVMLRNKRS